MPYNIGQSVLITGLWSNKLEHGEIFETFTHWTGALYFRIRCNDGGWRSISQQKLDMYNMQ